jgi:hypothetical protein
MPTFKIKKLDFAFKNFFVYKISDFEKTSFLVQFLCWFQQKDVNLSLGYKNLNPRIKDCKLGTYQQC